MSDNNSNIQVIDFEEIFKETNVNRLPERKVNPKRASTTLILYFVLFILGFAALFTTLFVNVVAGKNSSYTIISKMNDSKNQHLVSVMPKDEYFAEITNFEDLEMVPIEFDDPSLNIYNYVLITKNKNQTNIDFLNEPNMISKILHGNVKSWPKENVDDEVSITIVYNQKSLFYTSNKDLIDKTSSYVLVTMTNFQENLMMFLTYLIVFVPLILFYKLDIRDDYLILKRDYHPVAAKLLESFALYIILTVVLGLISSFLASLLPNVSSTSQNQSAIELMLTTSGGFLTFFTIVFFGPAVEEIVFRKAIFDVIKKPNTAFIVSSLAFGLIHLTTEILSLLLLGTFTFVGFLHILVLAIPYVGMGFFFSYLYKKHNYNLTLVIIIHALGNLLAGLSVLFL